MGIVRRALVVLVSVCIVFLVGMVGITGSVKAIVDDPGAMFTQVEREYMAQNPMLKVLVVDGAAPIQYTDKYGELQGISKQLLDEISRMTGFDFEYIVVDSIAEAFEAGAVDIICAIPPNYAKHLLPSLILSPPFLQSSTVLYLHSSVDPSDLDDKIYAALSDAALPKGIKAEQVLYFDTREACIDAVECGKADYGYGNAYSVAFYALQNGYRNIITIPQQIEAREYCMGFVNEDGRLISIINKALYAIDHTAMRNLIIDAATRIDRKITPWMMLDAYGNEIALVALVIIGLLVFGIVTKIRANSELQMQNQRYEILSELANEYLYEYKIRDDELVLSERCLEIFGTSQALDGARAILKDSLLRHSQLVNRSEGSCKSSNDTAYEIKVPLAGGGQATFKVINSCVCDKYGNTKSLLGKLVDISKEMAEKEALVVQAQTDGLTGLYNATTYKALVMERLHTKEVDTLDAFILFDVDSFKEINDGHGHYVGDHVLQNLAEILRRTFRSTDIIGRIGGDEFCVYMKDVPSVKAVSTRCRRLSKMARKISPEAKVSVSAGIALVDGAYLYEELFQMADNALYQAKHSGRGRTVVFKGPRGLD